MTLVCAARPGSRRVSRSIIILLSVFLGGGTSSASASETLSWQSMREGLALTLWEPGLQCDEDVPPLVVVRINPEQYRFTTYHYLDEKLPAPLTMKEWQRRTGAVLLFNAGLFRDDYSYLGWLFKDGRPLGAKRHPQWQGLFVAEPIVPGLRKARVVDLAVEPFSAETMAYREAAQSLMLLDQKGKPRVRQSGKRAHQTVVAEDHQGNILVMKTTEAVGLWDLAICLRDQFPAIHQAMVMDGGGSSELLLDPDLAEAQTETLQSFRPLVDGGGMGHIPLPAVIGVAPRQHP